MSELEVPLHGGNVTDGLVRVGDTVRRPAGPWSRSVHDLLVHLAAVGFDGAPRSLGFDQQGRHVLEFVPGVVAHPAPPGEAELDLRRVGRLLRDLHDACAEHVPRPDAVWGVVIPPDRQDLVVHHDVAPWNLVLSERRWVLIDWDTAGPGSRLWDLAYAAHGFVPLSPTLGPGLAGPRLRALAEGYRLDEPGRRELAGLLHRRVLSMYDLLLDGAQRGVQPWARLWDEGHGEYWRLDAEHVAAHEQEWLTALLDGR